MDRGGAKRREDHEVRIPDDRQLGLTEITLAFFVERVDDASRQKYEARYTDLETGVAVTPVFVATD